MRTWLPVAHLLLSLVILVWDVVLAGRIAQLRQAPWVFAGITGLAGLLVVPAALVELATSTAVTGRAIMLIDWLWPLVLVLFAFQAIYAMGRRLVNPTWGVPIAIYDVIIAIAGLTRYAVAHGAAVPQPLIVLLAARSNAIALTTTASAFTTPIYLNVPMISPAFPALRKITAVFRAALSAAAAAWVVLIAVQLAPADLALRSYARHAADRLTERPDGDFDVGLKLLPDIGSPPPAPAVRADNALADTLAADAVGLVIVPDVGNAVLDSVAHSLEQLRRDSTVLIVALGYRGQLVPELRHVPLNPKERLTSIQRIVHRLHPDILLPAEDPYGIGARLLGRLTVEEWKDYLTRAAAVAKGLDRRVRVGVSIAAFDSRDSALYAWAAGAGSPLDVVGFSFFPNRLGGASIDARMRAADRWVRVSPPVKDHWVFASGGYPLAYGERSQEQAIWAALAWSTARQWIKGVIVYEAGDYGQSRGLRAPSGRLRPATLAVMRALRGLKETAQP
jgi:hypothetical protein